MGLRDRLRSSVRSVLDRFSGEYSAASGEIRPDTSTSDPAAPASEAPKVTRARLRRPADANDQKESSS